MARFDLYTSARGDFAVDVQADLLEDFGRRVVVPLLPLANVPRPRKDLHPTFLVEGRMVVMATHYISSVRRAELGRPKANLAHYRDDITRALDMLFTGF